MQLICDRKPFKIFPTQGKWLQFNDDKPLEAMVDKAAGQWNNLKLLVPSLPAWRSVTWYLVLKVTLTNKMCLWLRGLYAEHKTQKSWRSGGWETEKSRKMLTPFQYSRKSIHTLMSLLILALSSMWQWGSWLCLVRWIMCWRRRGNLGNHPACKLESDYKGLKFLEGGWFFKRPLMEGQFGTWELVLEV